MSTKKTPGTVTNYRDSRSGQFVTERFVRQNPAITETERNPRHTPPSRPNPPKGRK